MHILYTMARLFPFWAIPMGVILLELGRFYHRRKRGGHVQCWSLAGVLFLASLAWIILRGDLHSDRWMRALFGA